LKVVDHHTELSLKHAVVTSGTFDGVHFGHRRILQQVVDMAREVDGESIVVTYWPHPRFVLGKDADQLRLLSTFEEKIKLVEEVGIDYLVRVHFTREFSELSSDEFIQSVLINRLNTQKLIIGYDHRFGKDQEGSFEYLKQNQKRYGFEVMEIPPQDIDDVTVSSTRIRKALRDGDVKTANEYLGRYYELTGLVTKGEQVGRKIGFPTANIYVPETYKLIPADGVYAVWVFVNGRKYKGMLNIGNRPTLHGQHRTIEVHIFDFNWDIYGTEIEVSFVEQLRKEQKFEDLNALKNQLANDKEAASKILK
jgi:riboflavin kinase/FMN adenylyltransferase